MTTGRTRFAIARRIGGGLFAAAMIVTACSKELPTAAEVEKMDVAAFEKRAAVVKIGDGPTEYYVDGVRVTPEMARNVQPESIASVSVLRPTMRDDATDAQRAAAPARVEISMIGKERRPLLEGQLRTTSGETFEVRAASGVALMVDSVQAAREAALPRKTHEGPTPIFLINGKVVEASRVHALPATAIKSVEVMKGVAAIRKYGAAGANGAIVVITKQ